jgi:uncharacterized membrane protein YfcA
MNMKTRTLTFGVICSVLIFLGVTLKIQHWPGAGILITLFGTLFAFFYAVMLLIDKNKVAHNGYQKLVNFLTALTMMIVAIAFVFKAQHWAGAGIGIFAGHFCLLAMIPVLYIQAYKEDDPIKKLNAYNNAVLLTIATAFSMFIWLRTAALQG